MPSLRGWRRPHPDSDPAVVVVRLDPALCENIVDKQLFLAARDASDGVHRLCGEVRIPYRLGKFSLDHAGVTGEPRRVIVKTGLPVSIALPHRHRC